MEEKETVEELTDEFREWCEDNEIPHMSAEEILAEDNEAAGHYLTHEQRGWILAFIERWDRQQAIIDRLAYLKFEETGDERLRTVM